MARDDAFDVLDVHVVLVPAHEEAALDVSPAKGIGRRLGLVVDRGIGGEEFREARELAVGAFAVA